MRSKWKNIALAVLSGILGFLAFPPFEFAFLGWVCLVPVLFVVRSGSLKEAFFYPFLSGMVFFGCLLYWFVNVSIPGMLILVFVLSVFYGLFGVIAGYVLRHSIDLLLLPFVWVVFEYIRSHIFTGFPWGLLGYSQYKNVNLIQIADLTGAYGVSFLLVVCNVAIFAWLVRSKKKAAYMVTALLFLIMATAYSAYRFNNYYIRGSSRISVVQGNIPQRYKWDAAFAEEIVARYGGLTEKAAKDGPDMIIWPETSYPYLVEKGDNPAGEISALASGQKIPILAGIVYRDSGSYYNSAVLFDEKGKFTDIYSKTHLVPFGEYVPFEKHLSFLREHVDKPIGNFENGEEYTLFPVRSLVSGAAGGIRTRRTNFYKFGVLICFEDVFPYITREFARKGADFMVNITNDAWFGETAAPRQHLQSSVFRAVENRIPVIRAANTGISCFVDSTGKILPGVEKEGKEIFVSGFATDNVNMYAGRTYYTIYGDIFVYFCAFMIILLVITERFFLRGKKGN
ncbi:MAG: apolipoprotein N-acyltransferase [Candidatus Makaraimicrobium thalassicum]|nr:MAG: apolipoprotein N-acyltransferase [Candidatus Omnitrophota bacterium]